MSDIQQKAYGAGEFLALLLEQVEQLYRDNTDDFASLDALDIAIAAIEADEKMNERSAETILEKMAALASWMLHTEFSPATRARLETIRDTCPMYAEPAPLTGKVEDMLDDPVLKDAQETTNDGNLFQNTFATLGECIDVMEGYTDAEEFARALAGETEKERNLFHHLYTACQEFIELYDELVPAANRATEPAAE